MSIYTDAAMAHAQKAQDRMGDRASSGAQMTGRDKAIFDLAQSIRWLATALEALENPPDDARVAPEMVEAARFIDEKDPRVPSEMEGER